MSIGHWSIGLFQSRTNLAGLPDRVLAEQSFAGFIDAQIAIAEATGASGVELHLPMGGNGPLLSMDGPRVDMPVHKLGHVERFGTSSERKIARRLREDLVEVLSTRGQVRPLGVYLGAVRSLTAAGLARADEDVRADLERVRDAVGYAPGRVDASAALPLGSDAEALVASWEADRVTAGREPRPMAGSTAATSKTVQVFATSYLSPTGAERGFTRSDPDRFADAGNVATNAELEGRVRLLVTRDAEGYPWTSELAGRGYQVYANLTRLARAGGTVAELRQSGERALLELELGANPSPGSSRDQRFEASAVHARGVPKRSARAWRAARRASGGAVGRRVGDPSLFSDGDYCSSGRSR